MIKILKQEVKSRVMEKAQERPRIIEVLWNENTC